MYIIRIIKQNVVYKECSLGFLGVGLHNEITSFLKFQDTRVTIIDENYFNLCIIILCYKVIKLYLIMIYHMFTYFTLILALTLCYI